MSFVVWSLGILLVVLASPRPGPAPARPGPQPGQGPLRGVQGQGHRLRQTVESVQDHKFLTHAVKDYKEPMAGTTLALYKQLDTDLQKLADDWLRRMDAWEKAEALIRSEQPLGAGPSTRPDG